MCLIAFAIDQHPRFPLVVASNRDEFFDRPTERLGWWTPNPGAPDVLSGRDLQAGGTWLGLTAPGRIAMLTNVRNGSTPDASAPSRGRIVTDWLAARESTADFWSRTGMAGHNGFNLIAADFSRGECFWGSNISGQSTRLGPGLYGVSNAGLETPWPKVVALKARVREALDSATSIDALVEQLFAALGDRIPARDDALPHTGIPLARERRLSAAFIHAPDARYGTRCSTVIVTERTARAPITHVVERSFGPAGEVALLRSVSLPDWPPRDSVGELVEAFEAVEASPRPDQSARVISMCAMPASSNTGPAGTKPARA